MAKKKTQIEDNGLEELEAALQEEELAEGEEPSASEDGDDNAEGAEKESKSSGSDGDSKEPDEALEELEAAELEIEDDPATLLIDEAAEIREMRREELGLTSGQEMQSDEFVCTECFLMKATSQLANKSRKVCADCV